MVGESYYKILTTKPCTLRAGFFYGKESVCVPGAGIEPARH